MTPKPFYKKSETWLTLISLLAVGLTAVLKENFVVTHPAVYAAFTFAVTMLTAAYTLGRSYVYGATNQGPTVG